MRGNYSIADVALVGLVVSHELAGPLDVSIVDLVMKEVIDPSRPPPPTPASCSIPPSQPPASSSPLPLDLSLAGRF